MTSAGPHTPDRDGARHDELDEQTPAVPADEPAAPEDDRLLAPRAALARAQHAAAEKGLRPGSRPLRRHTKLTGPSSPQRKKRNRDPELLGSNLKDLLDTRGWNVDVAAGSVMGRWNELVGRDVSQHAQPVTFEAGVLTVRAESTAWATQLTLLSSTLISRIEAGVGPGVVSELRIVGPAAPSWVKGPRRVRGQGPRDTYG